MYHCKEAWDEEAIPERNPYYQLPVACGCASESIITLTYEEWRVWLQLVQIRPMLAWFTRAS